MLMMIMKIAIDDDDDDDNDHDDIDDYDDVMMIIFYTCVYFVFLPTLTLRIGYAHRITKS